MRVQSPPPLSPDTPYSASSVGDENINFYANQNPASLQKEDSFDSKFPALDAEGQYVKKTQPPTNPFSRTHETLERGGQAEGASSTAHPATPGKGTMDVDAFKRMLLTGTSALGKTSPSAAPPAQTIFGAGDNSSNTDTSSISRNSMSDQAQEAQLDSPRTSHEMSEPEDDRRVVGTDFTSSVAGRKKPPPPSSRHGKMIKVELKENSYDPSIKSSISPDSSTPKPSILRNSDSVTDLNKPLPLAPRRSSYDEEGESVFDQEAAGKIPDPPSPTLAPQRKKPPTPPIARRHSQLVAESKLTRSNSGRLSPKPEEDTASIRSFDTGTSVSRSNSTRAPPPPPSRRPASIRNNSITSLTQGTPTEASPFPPPPPPRGSSRSISSRPPSISGIENIAPIQGKRNSMVPPPPPPRHGRSSMDGNSPGNSRRPSGEYNRRSSEQVRRGSTASSLSQVESAVAAEPLPMLPPRPQPEAHDVLADLSALQREIDALRGSKQGENVS